MSLVSQPHGDWTAVDLVRRFGPIALRRIRGTPLPGTATEADVECCRNREERLCELVDGALVEKILGTYEAYLAALVLQLVGEFARRHRIGVVLGADGIVPLAPGLVRIPDMSFISWNRLPAGKLPRDAVASIVPDLAVAVISSGNTPEEMQRKLDDYFAAGVGEVWYVYPDRREVLQYVSGRPAVVIAADGILTSTHVLPGFALDVANLFADPTRE